LVISVARFLAAMVRVRQGPHFGSAVAVFHHLGGVAAEKRRILNFLTPGN